MRLVQLIPSGLVITLSPVPVLDTATNKPISGAHVIDCQLLPLAGVRLVQVIPSGLVIATPSPTAANRLRLGDQQADCHELKPGVVLEVQLIPSGLVITPSPTVVDVVATSRFNPGDHATYDQPPVLGVVRLVQFTPLGLVITPDEPMSEVTATNNPRAGAQVTACQPLLGADCKFQLIPFELVMTLFVPLNATAANNVNSGDHATDRHALAAALVREVQTIPMFGSSPGAAVARICPATIPGIIRPPAR